MRIRSLLAAASAALLLTPVAAQPAQAAGTCSVRMPVKLVIDSPYEKFGASVASNCAAADVTDAHWSVRHSYYGPTYGLSFDLPVTTTTWDLYDWQHVGTYYIEPGYAYDSEYNKVPQNKHAISVRYGSRAYLTSSRSGSSVTLAVNVRHYHESADAFGPYAGRTVALQYRTASGTWTTFKTVRTSSSGKASYRFTKSAARSYRAVVPDAAKVWGRTSAVTRR